MIEVAQYHYGSADPCHHHAYLLPALERILKDAGAQRVLDLGCGNGAIAHHLSVLGYDISGIDASEEGIKHGRAAYPHLKLHLGNAYDDLASNYGQFPIVISLEVVEHLYDPRSYARTLYSLVEEHGTAVVSTPYHGYLKNLALAISGKMDAHFTVLWDHGHIKFWSRKTLRELLNEAGFADVRFVRVGRIPTLAKSMIAVARK